MQTKQPWGASLNDERTYESAALKKKVTRYHPSRQDIIGGQLKLKEQYDYYNRIQANFFFFTGRESHVFPICTVEDMKSITIKIYDSFFCEMTVKLGDFYDDKLRKDMLKNHYRYFHYYKKYKF